ncbi:nitrogen fixation protein NifR [Staphylococcus aureus]|uniref:Nitrogen fixation protein NifR n=1 Tax=Staphylococcus aureus TaxID=1280 RepID=A0AAQ1HVX4_STAAU|nr:nitrogen fixation protein NifR [Staphylococcus aureus]AUI38806.1 nitrogen fixation protein NifR [Staphylococcus aureus]AUM83419.1 nitrogen fixation protein NifR [Staphylococcus aureus]AUM84171.1 nitrogen fixation protein NifR [Staphylococcus aureus]AUM84805.1 nitrogen fixation protein NifR [Staphylococcus aureus]
MFSYYLVQGPQHREIGPLISTNNASWGGAPTFVRNLSYAYFLC